MCCFEQPRIRRYHSEKYISILNISTKAGIFIDRTEVEEGKNLKCLIKQYENLSQCGFFFPLLH
jgi:hypothetical protein